VALVAAAAFLGPAGAGAWLVAGGQGLALGAFVRSRLGGLTGDSYGAIIALVEAVMLLTAVAVY